MKALVSTVAVLVLGLLVVGCSGQGEDIIDPGAGDRDQSALLALVEADMSDLGRYSELSGVVSSTEYSDLNGGENLPTIDGIYEAFDQIYLHHNSTGTITVVDAKTRVKMADIEGFPFGDEGHLCGMAFSNLSQAWVVAYGSKFLYLIDAQNLVLVPPIPLPDNPTAVATSGNRVFVAMGREVGTG